MQFIRSFKLFLMPDKAKTRFCIFSWKPATTCRFRLMPHLLSFGVTILPDPANTILYPNNSPQNHPNTFFDSPQPCPEILPDGFRRTFPASFANTFLLHNFFNYLKFNDYQQYLPKDYYFCGKKG